MRTLLVMAVVISVAAQVAAADVFPNMWLRGASSVAVNDDATALFLNPAGLAANDGSNTYAGLSLYGDEVAGVQATAKMGPLGLGYDRQYMWRQDGASMDITDRAVDTYYAGIGLGDRGFSVGVDYRWLRSQFGDEEKAGTWCGYLGQKRRQVSPSTTVRPISRATATIPSSGFSGGVG